MADSKIKSIKAREILDSRGNPTIEVELKTESFSSRASVPSGASTGSFEAVELRDGGKRYQGKGVQKAVANVNEIIAKKLEGMEVTNQKEIDRLMVDLDGTENKAHLGANALTGVSLAVCRAGALVKNIPLYQHVKEISNFQFSNFNLPFPCFNIINGGAHAGNELDFQEFMVVPTNHSFSENLRIGSEIYHQLKNLLFEKYGKLATNLGDEGGFAPPISFPEEALDFISAAIKNSQEQSKEEVKIISDVAASQFFVKGKYKIKKGVFTEEGLLRYYFDLISKHPFLGLEDPFAEEDWKSWQELISKLKIKNPHFLVIGDDLLVTNPKRIKEAKEKEACNAMILKINQIGTVSEAIEAARLAKNFGWKIIVSHRSGETNDDFIADFAVGISADFIKSGAPARGERMAKYNRLLKIEKEI